MSKSFRIDHPDGTFVTPSGKTITVRGGVATVEDTAAPQAQPQQPQLGDDNYQDNYTGLGGSVRSYADAALGGLPTYANAGLETLYDQLKEKFGGTPSGTGWKESWDQNLGMEQKRARSAASQHKMDAVAGQILSPANLVPGLPIATGASYANALGEDPLVGAAWGTLPVAGQGIAKGAKTISKYGPAIIKGLREGDGPYLRSVLKAIEETNAAQPKPLPEVPRRPPSMRAPQEPMPDVASPEPAVDPRIGARVESLPRNAPKTEVTPTPSPEYQQPAQWDRLRAPKTSVDPLPEPTPEPGTSPSLRSQGKLPPELDNTAITPLPDKPGPPVPDDGMLAKLEEMVARNKPTTLPPEPGTPAGIIPKPLAHDPMGAYLRGGEEAAKPVVEAQLLAKGRVDPVEWEKYVQNLKNPPPASPPYVQPPGPPTPLSPQSQSLAGKADAMVDAWKNQNPNFKPMHPDLHQRILNSRSGEPFQDPWSPIPESAQPMPSQPAQNYGSWLDRLRGRLKELVGPDGNVAKAMENPEARIRARGEKP